MMTKSLPSFRSYKLSEFKVTGDTYDKSATDYHHRWLECYLLSWHRSEYCQGQRRYFEKLIGMCACTRVILNVGLVFHCCDKMCTSKDPSFYLTLRRCRSLLGCGLPIFHVISQISFSDFTSLAFTQPQFVPSFFLHGGQGHRHGHMAKVGKQAGGGRNRARAGRAGQGV